MLSEPMYWLTALLAIVVVFARDFGWKAYVHMRQPKLYHIHAEIQKFGPPGTKAGGAEVVHAAEEGLPSIEQAWRVEVRPSIAVTCLDLPCLALP